MNHLNPIRHNSFKTTIQKQAKKSFNNVGLIKSQIKIYSTLQFTVVIPIQRNCDECKTKLYGAE